jgi:hypothetical protein
MLLHRALITRVFKQEFSQQSLLILFAKLAETLVEDGLPTISTMLRILREQREYGHDLRERFDSKGFWQSDHSTTWSLPVVCC